MNNNIPLLSIGLPVYNSSEYLKDVLDSLLNQSFSDFELIISDDASKDDTVSICNTYAQNDSRIRFIAQESNIGMTRNQNFVLDQAQGKYFMWTAHDDYYHRDFIKHLIGELERDPKLVTTFCPIAVFSNSIDEVIRVCQWDFSGETAFSRILSFCRRFNDAPFYGIHRRQALEKIKVPTWWGKNALTPANSNYPVVFYLLASGGYKLASDIPLFYKRKKEEAYLLNPYNHGLAPYWYLILRKINLFVESIKYLYRGSHSLLLAGSLTLPIFLRISRDTAFDLYYRFKCTVLKRKK
ncbi:MAG: glycosyltransferase family 2 protein [Bacteroidota bacterium]|nr:glycosyltransferase family 2 protein [Bacteroidota bacterium]